MGDYLDVLAGLTGGRAPGGLIAFEQDPAARTGLLNLGALTSSGGPSGLLNLDALGGGHGASGLLNLEGLTGGGGAGGGLLNMGALENRSSIDAFAFVRGLGAPWTSKGLDPTKDAQAAVRAGRPAAGHTGASGVLPATIPDTARPLITEAAQTAGLSLPLVAAVMAQESMNFNPEVMAGRRNSPAGAIGPMQLMPDTAAGLRVDPYDPRANAIAGARYLASLLQEYHGDLNTALVAYNGGPRAVARYRAGTPFQETQDYLAGVNRRMGEYQQAQAPAAAEVGTEGGAQGGSPFAGGPFRISFGFNQAYGSAQFNTAIPNHRGVDLKPIGGWSRSTPVSAMRGGTVEYLASDPNGGLGLMIRDSNNLLNAYFHLGAAAPGLGVGSHVDPGQLIAYGGGNADHLHLEVRRAGNGDATGNLIDPISYFNLR